MNLRKKIMAYVPLQHSLPLPHKNQYAIPNPHPPSTLPERTDFMDDSQRNLYIFKKASVITL